MLFMPDPRSPSGDVTVAEGFWEKLSGTLSIERWLQIAEVGIESSCERWSMTRFPAPEQA